LSRAQAAIVKAMQDLGMPASIRGSPAGAGQVFAQNMVALPLLLLAAFGAI
jgi:multidrug efflux pump